VPGTAAIADDIDVEDLQMEGVCAGPRETHASRLGVAPLRDAACAAPPEFVKPIAQHWIRRRTWWIRSSISAQTAPKPRLASHSPSAGFNRPCLEKLRPNTMIM